MRLRPCEGAGGQAGVKRRVVCLGVGRHRSKEDRETRAMWSIYDSRAHGWCVWEIGVAWRVRGVYGELRS